MWEGEELSNDTRGNEIIHMRAIIPDKMTPAGLYVHIPFCSSRCSYCDFTTGLYQRELAEGYVRALVREICASSYAGQLVDTIYFGGGTPSLLDAAQLDRILAALFQQFVVEDMAEITLEINPG